MSPAHAADPPAVPVDGAAWLRDEVPPTAREAAVAVVGVVVLALVGYGLALGLHLSNLHNGLLALVNTAVGLYVLRHRPRHGLGRLFVAAGLLSGIMFFGRQYALHQPSLPASSWLAWLSLWSVPLAMALAGWAVLLFPTGRPTTPTWRRVGIVTSVVAVLLAVSSALWPIEDNWAREGLTFPIAVPGAEVAARVAAVALPVAYLSFLVLWAAAVVVRGRRASREEIRQLRWFGYAVLLVLALMLGGMVLASTPVPGQLATPLIPLAAGVAILRYRLYDIDPIISRTVVVGVLAGLVMLGYLVVVVGVGTLVPTSSPVLPLLATAVVAVVFEPVRRRAQRLANRLVHGTRATPYEALSSLSAQLDAPPDDVLDRLCATVAHAAGATSVDLWVGDTGALRRASSFPTAPTTQRGPDLRAPHSEEVRTIESLGQRRGATVRPVRHQGSTLGALVVRTTPTQRLLPTEERLLDALVRQAGLVIAYRDRLHEVGEQADRLRGAARRVVLAQDETRRRLERDLHDGAQHRLVTLALELGEIADRAVAGGDDELVACAERARRHLLEATAELRTMARGLHPAVLTQDGLVAAVANLADSAALPVRLDLALDRRLPPEVEAAAYFVVAEALTNAARHSGADEVRVSLAVRGGALQVEVVDDGSGGALVTPGGGLQGLADRLAALGARLVVSSPPGGGSTVRAEFGDR